MKPETKKKLGLVLRLGVSIALMAYVFYTIPFLDHLQLADGTEVKGEIVNRDVNLDDPEATVRMWIAGEERSFKVAQVVRDEKGAVTGLAWGFWPIVRHTDKPLFAGSFCLMLACVFITSYRWCELLKVQGIEMSHWRAARLTWVGMFYNNVLPGLTGGDLVKMYAAARDTPKKTEAVVSVMVDRLLGIFVLGLIAAVVVLLRIDDPQFRRMAVYIYAFVAAGVLGTVVIMSRRIRRALRLPYLVGKLPFGEFLKNVDRAVFLYRTKKKVMAEAFALSVANHLVIITAVFGFGRAIGISRAGYVDYLVFFPVASIISAIPINVGGWGVGEMLFKGLFGRVGVSASKAVALSVLYRLSMNVFVSLPGAFLMPGKKLASAEEMEEEVQRDLETAPETPTETTDDPPAE